MKRSHGSLQGLGVLSKGCVLIATIVAGLVTAPASAGYVTGFQWVRSTDWTPGTVNNSALGNPDGDAMGNPTWYYERSLGGNLASANPWYAQPRTPLIWRTGLQQWRAGTQDESPVVGSLNMAQADINFTFDSPIARWQNPTGSALVVDIGVDTDVVSFRHDANSTQLELAIVKMSGSTFTVLWSDTTIAPNNGVIQPGGPVTLQNVSLGANDALLFTYRNKLDTPLGGNGSTAWYDLASVTIDSMGVPLPASVWSGLGLLAGLAALKLLSHSRRSQMA